MQIERVSFTFNRVWEIYFAKGRKVYICKLWKIIYIIVECLVGWQIKCKFTYF